MFLLGIAAFSVGSVGYAINRVVAKAKYDEEQHLQRLKDFYDQQDQIRNNDNATVSNTTVSGDDTLVADPEEPAEQQQDFPIVQDDPVLEEQEERENQQAIAPPTTTKSKKQIRMLRQLGNHNKAGKTEEEGNNVGPAIMDSTTSSTSSRRSRRSSAIMDSSTASSTSSNIRPRRRSSIIKDQATQFVKGYMDPSHPHFSKHVQNAITELQNADTSTSSSNHAGRIRSPVSTTATTTASNITTTSNTTNGISTNATASASTSSTLVATTALSSTSTTLIVEVPTTTTTTAGSATTLTKRKAPSNDSSSTAAATKKRTIEYVYDSSGSESELDSQDNYTIPLLKATMNNQHMKRIGRMRSQKRLKPNEEEICSRPGCDGKFPARCRYCLARYCCHECIVADKQRHSKFCLTPGQEGYSGDVVKSMEDAIKDKKCYGCKKEHGTVACLSTQKYWCFTCKDDSMNGKPAYV